MSAPASATLTDIHASIVPPSPKSVSTSSFSSVQPLLPSVTEASVVMLPQSADAVIDTLLCAEPVILLIVIRNSAVPYCEA